MERRALLLIAHGSRRAEANADLDYIAERVRIRGVYDFVATSFLELAEPAIAAAGDQCVRAGATNVVMMPYFLSPGVHVTQDLTAAREALQAKHPSVRFQLAEPLGRHEALVDIVLERASMA